MATDIRSQLDQGITLPFSWLADPAVFALEQERIFARGWQYAGPLEWVADPGQYLTCRAGLVPVVVVRDREGALNGFVNICRHRATEVARGRGRRETLQCPYHAWTYDLDACVRRPARSWSLSSTGRSLDCCRWRWTPGGRWYSSTATSTRRL
jgi:phenylpropionate dioxygenase-like ring-hydroxylating dioxygenase large terminal subunit